MKKIMIFNGSPRKNGYISKMIEIFKENTNHEVFVFNCHTANVSPCTDCRYCVKHYECVIKDDMAEVYDRIAEADVLIFATPVYFYSVSAQIKKMIDRFQVYFYRHINKKNSEIKNKVGAIFAVGGAKEYPTQFDGIEHVVVGTMENVNCELKSTIYASGTDRFTDEDMKKLEDQIKDFIKTIE